MEEIEITIVNWEKFNPQDFKTKYPHWFRMNKDTLQSQSLFELTPEERWVWVGLLCLACEKKTDTIQGTRKYLAHRLGVGLSTLNSAVEKLATSSSLRVNRELTSSKYPATEQDSTRQDKTVVVVQKSEIAHSDPIEPFLKQHGIQEKSVKLWTKKWGAKFVCDELLTISAEFDIHDKSFYKFPPTVRVRQMLEKRWNKKQSELPRKLEWEK